MSGSNNPFFGKHHDKKVIDALKSHDKSYTKTSEFAQRVKDAMVGVDTSVDLRSLWTEKYGAEEAERLEKERRRKISSSMSGEGNPMFGRPAPLSSGGGVKGWYGIHFFRSLRELSYMLKLDSEKRRWRTGEAQDCSVPYVDSRTGQQRTYYPDFIVDDTRMVECKPTTLQGTAAVKAKAQAAQEFCKSRGWSYELTDVVVVSWAVLAELEASGIVKLTERTRLKLDANPLYPSRASGLR